MNELVPITQIQEISGLAPRVLSENKTSVERCTLAGNALIERIQSQGMSDSLDEEAATLIRKAKKTLKAMNEKRSPVTQLFDRIRTVFTDLEKEIDSTDGPVSRLQKMRDEYARKKLEEQERKRKEEQLRQAVEQAKVTYRLMIEQELYNFVDREESGQIGYLNDLLSNMKLDSYDKTSGLILDYQIPLINYDLFAAPPLIPPVLDMETCMSIVREVKQEKKQSFSEQYKFNVSETLETVKTLLPSKKSELENIAKASAEEALEMERKLKQREAEELAAKELERQKEAYATQQRMSMEKQQADMSFMFNVASSSVSTPVKAKIKKKIELNDPRGIMDVLNLWWTHEGCGLSTQELEKKFKTMITCCEKLANESNPIFIQSAFVDYVDEVKAK